MHFSFGGFWAEVHRHFGKYSPTQQSNILFRFSLAFSIFSLVLMTTGILVDQFHSEDPARIPMKDGRTYFGAGIEIGHSFLSLTYPECHVPELLVREESILFDTSGVTFDQLSKGPTGTDEIFDAFVKPGHASVSDNFFGDFVSFYKMSIAAKVLSWIAFSAQLLSVILMIWSRTPPASFLTRTPIFDQTLEQRTWGVIHHMLAVIAAVCLLADLCVVSLYLDLVVGRVIELSFELCNFNPGLDELETLKLFGYFLESYSDVNGATGAVYKVAMALVMVQVTLVFYLGMRKVKSMSGQTDSSLSVAKLRQLPWYCSLWRMRFSALFLVIAMVINRLVGLYAREVGYPLNIYFFRSISSVKTGSGSTQSGSLSDFIMDWTSKFYISEAIPNAALLVVVPMALALSVGSTDPHRFVSKILQLTGIIVFLKSFISLSSLLPVPATVIGKPHCYDPPPASLWSLKGFFLPEHTCNHLMFSLPAAGTTLGVMVVGMYVRYGQSVQRIVAYSFLTLALIGSLVLPIAARASYTSNVVIAVFVVVLLVTTQSQAFKVLFQFDAQTAEFTAPLRKLNFSPGEILNDKVIPNLQECVRRVEMYNLATNNAAGLRISMTEIEEIKTLYVTIGHAMQAARDAKPPEVTSPVGFARVAPGRLKTNTPPTPPPGEDEVKEILRDMIASQSADAVAEVVVNDSSSNTTYRTPVPISIAPAADELQRESRAQEDKQEQDELRD
jgi:hypothetical protein